MTDKFQKFYSTLESPGKSAFSITPANTALDVFTRAVYVGGDGDLVVTLVDDDTPVTFASVGAGSLLPIRVSIVHTTTTANSIVGIV